MQVYGVTRFMLARVTEVAAIMGANRAADADPYLPARTLIASKFLHDSVRAGCKAMTIPGGAARWTYLGALVLVLTTSLPRGRNLARLQISK
jgi:hypothetical protein